MESVGIRALKNGLSGYLKEVKNGKSLTVMERKKAVAILTPVGHDPEAQKDKELIQRGIGFWSGGKPKGTPRPVMIK